MKNLTPQRKWFSDAKSDESNTDRLEQLERNPTVLENESEVEAPFKLAGLVLQSPIASCVKVVVVLRSLR